MQITKLDTLAGIAVKYNVSVCLLAGHCLVSSWHFGQPIQCAQTAPSDKTTGIRQVADIKRANGLLSDTAMFAKEYLLIPSKSMSVG